MSISEIIRLARDVLFPLLLLAGVTTGAMLYLKISTLQKSINRTRDGKEEIVSTLLGRFINPADTKSTIGIGVGDLTSSLLKHLQWKNDKETNEN